MENKYILENMIKIRENREKELISNLEEGEFPDTVINDVRYLGKIKFSENFDGTNIEKESDVYLLIEEKDGVLVYKYYNENKKLMAYENDALEQVMPSKEFVNKDESILKQITKMDKEGKSLLEIEAQVEMIEKIAESLGIDPEDIENIDELDLEQIIEGEQQEKNNIISQEKTDSLDIKETTDLNENIKGTTLANKLGVSNIELPNGEKLTDGIKLARVSTSSLSKYTENSSNMIDSFVIIRNNGQAVPVGPDILEPDTRAGTNPTSDDLTVNVDGIVDRETNTSSYRIVNGNGREFIKVGHDEISGREIKYSQWSDEKGEYVNTELKTNRDTFMNDDTRQYLKARNEGVREATETLEKAENHEEQGDKETDVTLVDHDLNNDSHVHIDENDYIPNTNTTWRQFANECGYRDSNAIEKAQEKFEKECRENPEASNEEIIENIIEQQNEDFRHPQERKH